MINNKFEAYKIKRELKRSGQEFGFYRRAANVFKEQTGRKSSVYSVLGLYHEQNSNIQITTGDTTQIRTKKIPMILCLYEDVCCDKIKVNDFVHIGNNEMRVTGIVNIQEWSIIADISLEVVDVGVQT